MRRYNAMIDHWLKNGPPVYISVAGYLGIVNKKRPGSKAKTKAEEPGNLEDLLKMAGPGGMIHTGTLQ